MTRKNKSTLWPVPSCLCGCGRGDTTGDPYGSRGLSNTCYIRMRAHGTVEQYPPLVTWARGKSRILRCVRDYGSTCIGALLGVSPSEVLVWAASGVVPEEHAENVARVDALRLYGWRPWVV